MKAYSKDACRIWRGPLVEAVFGELTDPMRSDFETHLASCERCQAQLASFESTTKTFADAMPPRRRVDDSDLWRRLGPALDAIDTHRQSQQARHPGLRLGYPAAAALAAALLMLGLGLGLFVRAPVDVTTSPRSASDQTTASQLTTASDQTIDAEMGFARLLERSTPLLLGVANRQLGGTTTVNYDTAAERRRAEHLAEEAAALADDLEDQGFRRQADLLRDLEVVFLQLANLPEQQYRHGLAMVQATLESRALLFQLNVEAMRRL